MMEARRSPPLKRASRTMRFLFSREARAFLVASSL
nr:MAG TPA: hypothetical protein [Caudoviricetes sp.]